MSQTYSTYAKRTSALVGARRLCGANAKEGEQFTISAKDGRYVLTLNVPVTAKPQPGLDHTDVKGIPAFLRIDPASAKERRAATALLLQQQWKEKQMATKAASVMTGAVDELAAARKAKAAKKPLPAMSPGAAKAHAAKAAADATRKAADKPAGAAKAAAKVPGAPRSDAHAEAEKLLTRANGATVAELRKATGWKGNIFNRPKRIAAKLKRKFEADDAAGEERRLKIV
jgi:hypothetical protein